MKILMLSMMIPLLLSSSFCVKRSATAFVVRHHHQRRQIHVVTSNNRRRATAAARRNIPPPLISSSSSSSCFFYSQQQQPSSPFMTRMMMSTSSSSTDTSSSSASNTQQQKSSNDNKQQKQKQQQKKKQKQPNTGGLRKLPVVKRPNELMDRARKVPNRIKADSAIKNIRTRTRKQGAEKLNALSQALCLPLRDCVDGYKREFRRLHPFEKVVADLTVRSRQKKDGLTLSDLLDDIHEARKAILEATKEWIYKVKNCDTAKESNTATIEGITNLLDIYENLAFDSVNGICDLQSSLRSSPAIKLDTPAVVLVGAPNVGKSSIVREISSATPEVNNYPFTTRGMTLGHVEVFWSDDTTIAKAVVPNDGDKKKRKSNSGSINQDVMLGKYAYSQLCQIMDSPGVLVRQDGIERNEMEELTLAAMKHLPTAVMYVMDLSGQAGDKCSSVKDQLQLRKEIRERFPRRPWIDVVSKYDLGVVDGSLEGLEEILGPDTNYIKLSIHDGMGIDETRQEVLRMLGEVQLVLDAMSIVDDRTKTTN